MATANGSAENGSSGNGSGAGSGSYSFSPAIFTQANFDVDAFVDNLRRNVPLPKLRNELAAYFASLKSAMVELINKDYADFVSLSSNLVGLDRAINELTDPLQQLKGEVLSVKTVIDSELGELEAKLATRSRIREEKALLQRFISISRSVAKIEKLLGISQARPADATSAGPSPVARSNSIADEDAESLVQGGEGKLIERVASEFNQLQFYVGQCSERPFLDAIRPRIAAITTSLEQGLQRMFQQGIENNDVTMLQRCLHTYHVIDRAAKAEELFRRVVVKPFVNQAISTQKVAPPGEGLEEMYDSILAFVQKRCITVQQVASSVAEGAFDFHVRAVWPEIVDSIVQRLSLIFAPGIADVFHKNYTVTQRFVASYERLCHSIDSVKRLRDHPSTIAFRKRWSLPVYFQLRFQEIAGALETVLSSGVELASADLEKEANAAGKAKPPALRQKAGLTLWVLMQRCWDDSVYVPGLVHRFWKLTLQLVARYATWVRTLQPKTSSEDSGPSEHKSLAPSGAVACTAEPADIVAAIRDADLLRAALGRFLKTAIEPRLAAFATTTGETSRLEDAIEDSRSSVEEGIRGACAAVTAVIAKECAAQLEPVKSIPRQYRRTGRAAPTSPSPYVAQAFKPIETFIADSASQIGSRRQDFVAAAVQPLAARFLGLVDELLTSVKKTEDSLKRLKKMRKASDVTPAGLSDDDKIREQIFLDAQHFRDTIAKLGVDAAGIADVSKTLELVAQARAQAKEDSSDAAAADTPAGPTDGSGDVPEAAPEAPDDDDDESGEASPQSLS